MRPLARRSGLLVRELPDETLVYDLESHQAHCLNRSAGLVLRLCDGTRTPRQIAAALEGGAELDEREASVSLALAQLEAARLLAPAAAAVPATVVPPTEIAAEASRRDLLRQVGTALLIPAIVSVLAPTPAEAASACWFQDDCASHLGEHCNCGASFQCPDNTCVNLVDTAPTTIHCHPCQD